MNHADRLIDRIIFLGGHPNLQTVDPQRIGESAKESLECDLAGEHDARKLYIEARDHCEQVGDYVTKALFESLIADEEGHIDFLETQLELMGRIGVERWEQLNAEPVRTVADQSPRRLRRVRTTESPGQQCFLR